MDEDASGLTFEEWDPAQAVDKSQEPAPMIINSSQLRAAKKKSKVGMRSAPPLNLLLQGELVVLAVQLAFRGHLGPLEVIWGRAGPPRRSFCHS